MQNIPDEEEGIAVTATAERIQVWLDALPAPSLLLPLSPHPTPHLPSPQINEADDEYHFH
jgi:hypothetical protein